jgi:hypothetical protein
MVMMGVPTPALPWLLGRLLGLPAPCDRFRTDCVV